MTATSNIYAQRAAYSRKRLTKLSKRLADLKELKEYTGLTIFGAGSFARLEASQYSDIDMFFLTGEQADEVSEPHTKSLRIFGRVIEIVDGMGFPKFSNDCEYLVILPTKNIVENLGGRTDDHENYFTARMLLLLESYCLYGQDVFDEITAKIINSYFKDYPDHKQTFQPIFLLNDICRYWKTILLNYENKRNVQSDTKGFQKRKRRQKVRNFKLKYSRMTTCFASIASLGSYSTPVTEENILQLTKLTPRQRLDSIPSRIQGVRDAVNDVINGYAWFLEMTGLQTKELEECFSDKRKRTKMFQRANEYGDSMFKLLQAIDEKSGKSQRLLRYLVI